MLELSSPAFADGGPIPRAHTCDGADQSPPLVWRHVPAGTRGFALIADDPDAPAGTWVHWVLYGLAADTQHLPSGVPTAAELARPVACRQGTNDFRRTGYGGPCPPKGRPHRYVFTLYALDSDLTTPPGATKAVLLEAVRGHVLEEAKMIGVYGRGG
jgi:hypothetical protein